MERFGVGALSHRNRLSGSSLPMSGWKVSLMERYFLHVTTVSNGIIKDDEGAILANLQAARDEALESAQDILADAIKEGRDLDVAAVIVTDKFGQELYRVSLTEVVPLDLEQRLCEDT